MPNLRNSVIKTIAFYDLFSFPLTGQEIWRNLWSEEKLDLLSVLNTLEAEKSIETCEGFYFFCNQNSLVDQRKQRYLIAEKKYKSSRFILGLLTRLPFIRLVAVCNTLAMSNSRPESDIDLFIITAPNRIWLARFLAVLLLKIFQRRPLPDNTRDKICLSFFVDENHLNLERVKIQIDDIYLYYWVSQLQPIYGKEKLWQDFQSQNQWIKQRLAQADLKSLDNRRAIKHDSKLKKVWEVILNKKLGDWLEQKLAEYQQRILPLPIKSLMNQGKGVMIEKGMLKFHVDDRRQEFYDQWLHRWHKKII